MTPRKNWKRLGELLKERRIRLGYDSRVQFAEDTGVGSSRLLFDIEKAKRTNFSLSTLIGVEQAYEWERGSIRTVLDGGDPTPVEKPQGILVHVRDVTNGAQLRRDVRQLLRRLTDSQLVRVRDFITGLVDQD